jgi:hypothetical protein
MSAETLNQDPQSARASRLEWLREKAWPVVKELGGVAIKAAVNFAVQKYLPAPPEQFRRDYEENVTKPRREHTEAALSQEQALITNRFDKAVGDPNILPGNRSDDPAVRRIRTGEYQSTRMAVYDLESGGIGLSTTEPVKLDDGTPATRVINYAPTEGLGLSASDYIDQPNGPAQIVEHGPALATLDQVSRVEEIVGPGAVWQDPRPMTPSAPPA